MGLPPGIGILFRVITYPVVSWITNNVAFKATDSIKDIVCLAQGRIVDFRYFCEKKYQELDRYKEELNHLECSLKILGDNPKQPKLLTAKENHEIRYDEVVAEIENLMNAFEEEAIPMLSSFFHELEQEVLKYFKGREFFVPRMTVKMIFDVNKEGNVLVEDIFRGNGKYENHYWDKLYLAKDNTAFDTLISNATKKEYLCSNIPEYIQLGRYVNSRISNSEALKYKESFEYKWKPVRILFGRDYDLNWMKVWKKKNDKIVLDPDSCYKSTLVVPIGFSGNTNLSSEVKSYLGVTDQTSLPQGFLCFDHVYSNYFIEADKKLAYIVADLFSILWQEYLSFNDV